MSRYSRPRSVKSDRPSLYDEITQSIIAELEVGRIPWVQPWESGSGLAVDMPRNAATNRTYSGVNILLLWSAAMRWGFPRQTWLTFRQAISLGGNVRRGEHGTSIVYADRFQPSEDREDEPSSADASARTVLFLKRFTVFSVDQCEGLPPDLIGAPSSPIAENVILPEVADLIRASGADLRIGGDQAFYAPAFDIVQVPPPAAFFAPIDWHRTALHELGHWTGHSSRLARDQQGRFGTPGYAREELVAELCAAFCCASLGIRPTVRHADYIGSWLDVLRADNRAILRAASAASKAADLLLAFRPGAGSGTPPEEEEGGSAVTGVVPREELPDARRGD